MIAIRTIPPHNRTNEQNNTLTEYLKNLTNYVSNFIFNLNKIINDQRRTISILNYSGGTTVFFYVNLQKIAKFDVNLP